MHVVLDIEGGTISLRFLCISLWLIGVMRILDPICSMRSGVSGVMARFFRNVLGIVIYPRVIVYAMIDFIFS